MGRLRPRSLLDGLALAVLVLLMGAALGAIVLGLAMVLRQG